MGLKDIENIENYIVVYSTQDFTKLDVVYTEGIKYNDKIYYKSTIRNRGRKLNEGKRRSKISKIKRNRKRIF